MNAGDTIRRSLADIEDRSALEPKPVTLNELQQLATRTAPEKGQQHWFDSIAGPREDEPIINAHFARHIDLLHAVLGMTGEAGETADIVKKAMCYGKPLDEKALAKIKEEAGDCLWYIAGPLCRALGCTFEDLAMGMVEKLRKRYPEKYTDSAAIARVDYS